MSIVTPDFDGLPLRIPHAPGAAPKKMLTSSTLPDGRTLIEINNSSLSYLLSCGRKTYYSLERGLQGSGGSPPLIFGSAVHAALEIFYAEPRQNRHLPNNFEQRMEDLSFDLTLAAHLPDHFLFRAAKAFIEKNTPLAILPQTDKRSTSNGLWILKHYFQTYINDQYVVHEDAAGPMVERTAEAIIYEDDRLVIKLFGTIDVVLKDTITGEIMPADHKTASQLGSDFYNRLKPNHQYTGYTLLARRALGLETNFFLVNALQVKERPKTARGTPPNFARQITTRTEQDIQEFIETVIFAVLNYMQWRTANIWPMGQVNECAGFGGCQYLDICASPNELRENIIKAKYTEGTPRV